ncbi:MAG: zinc-ribbon domain-containing protein [Deltaproteobacteria bacterium]|nr:zinc-ribbon domain-containing protein [Deltaproteobacteria bacterium]
MRVRCPECRTVYVVDGSEADYRTRKRAKCSGCQAIFYVQMRHGRSKEDEKTSETTLLQSYFERRNGSDRRQNRDRRRKIDIEELPFQLPAKDVILICSEEGVPMGYMSHGQRSGAERRIGKERRMSS